MDAKILYEIKKIQKEFFEKFNMKLEVDLLAMKGLRNAEGLLFNEGNLNYYFNRFCDNIGADRDYIINGKYGRISRNTHPKEFAVLCMCARLCEVKRAHSRLFSNFFKLDRSMLYYYKKSYHQNFNTDEYESLIF